MSFPLIPDNLLEVALNLPLDQLDKICTTNKVFNRAVCDNELFWRRRTEKYFGAIMKPSNTSWKDHYRRLSARWTFTGSIETGACSIDGLYTIGLPTNDPIVQLDVWQGTIAMVSGTGQVWGMGDNFKEVLQNVETDEVLCFNEPVRVSGTVGIDAIQVSCGDNFMYILDTDGRLWSRGFRAKDTIDREWVAVILAWDTDRGYDGLGRVNGPTTPVSHVECGPYYVVAIDINHDVWVTGEVESSMFGPEYESSSRFQRLDLPFKVAKVSCGEGHIMYLDTNGNLWGIGDNEKGQLGISPKQHTSIDRPIRINGNRRIIEVSCVGDRTAFINTDLDLYICGSGSKGLTPVFQNARKVSGGLLRGIFPYTTIIDVYGRVWSQTVGYTGIPRKDVEFTESGLHATDVVSGDGFIVLKSLYR